MDMTSLLDFSETLSERSSYFDNQRGNPWKTVRKELVF